MNLHTGASSRRSFLTGLCATFFWGMPISYIIDREGRLSGYITGEVEWTSQQGRAFLEYYAHG